MAEGRSGLFSIALSIVGSNSTRENTLFDPQINVLCMVSRMFIKSPATKVFIPNARVIF